MLTIPLEKLTYIIEKAREFDAEVPAEEEIPGPIRPTTMSAKFSWIRPTIRPSSSCGARSKG